VRLGALIAMGARAWRARAGTIGERVMVIVALGVLTALGASAAHALTDPQHLATQVPEMVVSFTVGCVALESEAESMLALVATAAMIIASYFFDANAGSLRSGASYASALGVVLFPLVLAALGALGSAVASALGRREVAPVLVIPAVCGAALAMLGWLWQPFAICGALGAAATLVPKLGRTRSAREVLALVALAGAALGSFATARHTGLAHAGALGIAVAAIAAIAGAWLDDDEELLADRQAAALAAVTVALAVLDGASLFRCTRFADAAHAPTTDLAVMLAHCTLADVAPARIDVSHPATLASAILGIALSAGMHHDATLRGRVIALTIVVVSVIVVAAVAHLAFGVGLEAVAAATLASGLAAALFPTACSRTVAFTIAACALALGAVVG
jgi:hypothetical protein